MSTIYNSQVPNLEILRKFNETQTKGNLLDRSESCLGASEVELCFEEEKTMKEIGSSSEKRKYPRRLYPEGKSPILKRSMHHNCQLGSFSIMKDYIGDDVFADIRENSQVGVLLKLMESGYVWCAKTVHHFLTHQLAIDRRYEIWCLIEGSPLRFSLYEFAHITGLNCDTIESVENAEVNHREFWGDLKVDPGDGPNWNELVDAIRRSRGWSPEKRKMLEIISQISPIPISKTISDST